MRRSANAIRSPRLRWALLTLALIAPAVAGCITSNDQGVSLQVPPPLTDQIRQVDLGERFPQGVRQASRPSEEARGTTYLGDGSPVVASVPRSKIDDDPPTTGALTEGTQPGAPGQGYEMNFENT